MITQKHSTFPERSKPVIDGIINAFHGAFFSHRAVRFGAIYRTAPHRTAPQRTAPQRTVGLPNRKSAPNRTTGTGKSSNKLHCVLFFVGFYRIAPHRMEKKKSTAPRRRILQIEQSHRGSMLHRETPWLLLHLPSDNVKLKYLSLILVASRKKEAKKPKTNQTRTPNIRVMTRGGGVVMCWLPGSFDH